MQRNIGALANFGWFWDQEAVPSERTGVELSGIKS